MGSPDAEDSPPPRRALGPVRTKGTQARPGDRESVRDTRCLSPFVPADTLTSALLHVPSADRRGCAQRTMPGEPRYFAAARQR